MQPCVMEAASLAIHLHQHTWVLGVPTLVLFYSCLMCITDAPFRLWQTLVFSHSRIGGQLCALLYPVPGPILHPPHFESCHSYR